MTPETEQIRLLAQEVGEDLAFVVNQSGGKDSIRMMGLVRQKLPYAPTYAVMADTAFEHIAPVTAANWAGTQCAEFGVALSVVRNPKRTYLEMVEQLGMLPSAQFRHCTSDLNRGPIDRFTRSLPHPVIVNYIGIRAEESTPRACLYPLSVNRFLATRQRTVYNWFPIYERHSPMSSLGIG